MEHDRSITETRKEFDRRARDMQQRCETHMKTMRDEKEQQRKLRIQKIEEGQSAKMQQVKQKNQKDHLEIKNYYTEIKNSNLDLVKRLKEEHQGIKKREVDDARKMHDLVQRNSKLKEPLQKANQDVERLEAEVLAYDEDKRRLTTVKEKIKQREAHLNRMDFQHEVLQQQLQATKAEREEVHSKFSFALHDVQQKAGLKNLFLERKIDAAEEAVETTEAQVGELLASSGMDETTAMGSSQRLHHVLVYKDGIVDEMQGEVGRIRGLHRRLVKTYESKLEEHGVPREELGFLPAIC